MFFHSATTVYSVAGSPDASAEMLEAMLPSVTSASPSILVPPTSSFVNSATLTLSPLAMLMLTE